MATVTALQAYPRALAAEDCLAVLCRYDLISRPLRWLEEIDLRNSLSLTDTTPIREGLFSWRSGGPPLAKESSAHIAMWKGRKSPGRVPRDGGWPPTRSRMTPRTLGERGFILDRNQTSGWRGPADE